MQFEALIQDLAQDSFIRSNPWKFRLEGVSIPVDLWHGEEDANLSISAARHLARTIPNCKAAFLPEKGHWLILDCWEDILRSLLG